MKNKKVMFQPNNNEFIGKLTISATGLRHMANALQKEHKTKGDVTVKAYINKWKVGRKTLKTIGIMVK